MSFFFGVTNTPAPADFDDIFESAEQFESTLKPEYHAVQEKIRIVAYSDEYFQWLAWDTGFETPAKAAPAKSKATEIVEALKGTHCKACAGTGLYRIHKFNKDIPCAKCAGKGHITAIDEARTRAYVKRKAAGRPMDVSHTDYLH